MERNDRAAGERLNLTLILERGSGQGAARQSRERMTDAEWALLVEYALAVVCLQESLAPERVHLIPADSVRLG